MASHARGGMSKAIIARHYRHEVRIEQPWNGHGPRYTEMLQWLAKQIVPYAVDDEADTSTAEVIHTTVFKFPDQGIASDFVARFGGTLTSA